MDHIEPHMWGALQTWRTILVQGGDPQIAIREFRKWLDTAIGFQQDAYKGTLDTSDLETEEAPI
jgi:hypothetical protein